MKEKLVFVFFVVWCFWLSLAQAQKITQIKGEVEVQTKKAGKWVKAQEGMELSAGDRVRTKRGGSCVVVFATIASVKLNPFTNFVVTEAQVTGSGKVNINTGVTIGKTYHKIKQALQRGSSYQVHTPTAIAGVKSTYFSVEVLPTGGTVLSTFELTDPEKPVELTAQGVTQRVGAGQTSSVAPGEPPTAPQPITEEEKREAEAVEEELGAVPDEEKIEEAQAATKKVREEVAKVEEKFEKEAKKIVESVAEEVGQIIDKSKREVQEGGEQAVAEGKGDEEIKRVMEEALGKGMHALEQAAGKGQQALDAAMQNAVNQIDAISVPEGVTLLGDPLGEGKRNIQEIQNKARDEIAEKIKEGEKGLNEFAQNLGLEEKVAVCHVPPGAPQSRQTLWISASALPAHLEHGDTKGPCLEVVVPGVLTLTVDVPAETTQAEVTVTGKTAPQVQVTAGGVSVTSSTEGNFTIRVPLQVGQNTIVITATASDGRQVSLTKTVLRREEVIADTIPPAIVVTAPPLNSVFKLSNVTVNCKTEPGAIVTIQGIKATVGSDGSCSAAISLSEGRNVLNIEARDAAGNKTVLTHILVLDTIPPFLSVQSPRDNFQTCSPVIQLIGITEPKALLRVQGQNVKVESGGGFQVPLSLKPGGNQIKIEAGDEAGNLTQVLLNGKYDPVGAFLTVSDPPDNFVVHKPEVQVIGFTKPGAVVRINQRAVYVDPAGAFKEIVPLSEGKNSIIIDAQTTCGDVLTVTKNVTFTDIPPPPPGQ